MPRRALFSAAFAALIFVPMSVQAVSTEQVLTPRTFIEVSRRVLPGVVSISVEVPRNQEVFGEDGPQSMEEFLDRWFGDPNDPHRNFDWDNLRPEDFGISGAGSGVVVRTEGEWAYVLTNDHVVGTSDRRQITIRLDPSYSDEGNEDEPIDIGPEDVEMVGRDTLSDVAVLRFRIPEGAEIPTVGFADSSKLEVGEWVLALGNPLELNNSVSQGIISAKGRSIDSRRIQALLQTTAVINPGNSGGPLVNLEGEIVGINNAIASRTGQWAGVGFAIPGNYARKVAEQLIDKGSYSRGYLGIMMRSLSPSVAEAFDLDRRGGVQIEQVVPDGPAEQAGIEDADIVTEVDGRRINSPNELLTVIGGRAAGETAMLRVVRLVGDEKTEKEYEVVLAERPPETQLAEMERQGVAPWLRPREGEGGERRAPRQDARDQYWLLLEDLGISAETAQVGDNQGVLILEVEEGSSADKAGLRPGDLIVEANGERARSARGLTRILNSEEAADGHVLQFLRNGASQFVTIDEPEDRPRDE